MSVYLKNLSKSVSVENIFHENRYNLAYRKGSNN